MTLPLLLHIAIGIFLAKRLEVLWAWSIEQSIKRDKKAKDEPKEI